jgi:DNA-directed RNA polymerase subunit H (RpoH/RPB5)
MVKKETAIEKRAKLIIKYRKMKIRKKEENGDLITYRLVKREDSYVMRCVSNRSNVGIAEVRELRDLVQEMKADGGILLTDSKYTYSARHNAPGMNIELIPPTIPAFDIFKHKLVSPAEILNEEERNAVLERFNAEPYQFPRIESKDPVAIILGANSGDIVRFKHDSITAGLTETFRYVV